MEHILQAIKNGEELRSNLSALAEHLKSASLDMQDSRLAEAGRLAIQLLSAEDAKTRKNAARVLALLKDEGFVKPLMEAYRAEATLFVRPAYLQALKGYDLSGYVEELTERRETLLKENDPANRKHTNEELTALIDCIGNEVLTKQKYRGDMVTSDVLLLTNPLYAQELHDSLVQEKKRIVGGGVLTHCEELSDIDSNRLYRELLFVIPGIAAVSVDPYEIAARLSSDSVWRFLKERHVGSDLFSYRIELRSSMDERSKSLFLKRLNGEILRCSAGRLVNNPSNYHIEFRLLEKSEGGFRLLLKLCTRSDNRFSYRSESVAASIQPVDAAYCMHAFSEYFSEDAQILDPFCGVGTMLIERGLHSKVKIAFGTDTFGEAIEKARANAGRTCVPAHFIQRDFFDFRHESLFDEIVTNMPFDKSFDDQPVADLYKHFFEKAARHLKEGATLLMVSHNPSLVMRYMTADYELLKRVKLREKLPMEAFLLRRI